MQHSKKSSGCLFSITLMGVDQSALSNNTLVYVLAWVKIISSSGKQNIRFFFSKIACDRCIVQPFDVYVWKGQQLPE